MVGKAVIYLLCILLATVGWSIEVFKLGVQT